MIHRSRLAGIVTASLLPCGLLAADAPTKGPFFEPAQPFFQSQVEVNPPAKGQLTSENFVVRGILLPLASGHCVLFDQELLRVAAIWKIPAGGTAVTPANMAQNSYTTLGRQPTAAHPRPAGPALLATAVHPGVARTAAALKDDPRPPERVGDVGRGALPAAVGRFEGIERAGDTAILHYQSGTTAVTEWHESRTFGAASQVFRHFEIPAHAEPLVFAVGVAVSDLVRVTTNSAALVIGKNDDETVATLAPSPSPQRVTLALTFDSTEAPALPATPPRPARKSGLRWPGTATAPAALNEIAHNGLVFDRIATPDENPWHRLVRAADLAFLTDDRAAVVTYDGDVWLVDGFADPALAHLTWRRFASGLQEPLAIAAPKGVIQVATKNGVVRLHDRDGDGEADWFENFNDQMLQSQTTRSFPLDMAVGPDGSTYVTQGGIVVGSGMNAGGEGTAHTGGFFKISPDGRTSELFAGGAREPYVTVHPKTGLVTGTDQQGHWIVTSPSYLVRKGDNFGYMQPTLTKPTPALAWIPHEQDTSSASEVWLVGNGMGAWNGRLLHLSYGTSRLFVISPDLEAPVPQGAAIPLEIAPDLPLLHARMNLRGDALFLAGLQIYGARSTANWGLGRLRPGTTPIVTALAARSCADGVVLEFAAPLDPASLSPAKVIARGWNYRRSAAYGSGRYALDGSAGTTPEGVAQVVLSADRKSVFVHLPHLPAMAQLEVRHDFLFANGGPARGVVFFTINQPRQLDLAAAGFAGVDLSKGALAATMEKEELPTIAQGKELTTTLGCVVCHSSDGTTEGKVGGTWLRLFGTKRTFIDGTSQIADDVYLREKILDPQGKKMKPGQIEMPSFRGVLSEQKLESIVLYLRSLGGVGGGGGGDGRGGRSGRGGQPQPGT